MTSGGGGGALERVPPARLLLWSTLAAASLVPVALLLVSRVGDPVVVVGHVKLVSRLGDEIALPAATLWVFFGLASGLLHLVVAGVVGAILRSRGARTRNIATLAVLAGSILVSFSLLFRGLGLGCNRL